MTHSFQITDQGHIRYKAISTARSSCLLFPFGVECLSPSAFPVTLSLLYGVGIHVNKGSRDKHTRQRRRRYAFINPLIWCFSSVMGKWFSMTAEFKGGSPTYNQQSALWFVTWVTGKRVSSAKPHLPMEETQTWLTILSFTHAFLEAELPAPLPWLVSTVKGSQVIKQSVKTGCGKLMLRI